MRPRSSCSSAAAFAASALAGLAAVEAHRAPAEPSGVTLAAPGHRDHEADGQHPGRDPDRSPDQEAERRLQAPMGVLVAFLAGSAGEEPAEDQQRRRRFAPRRAAAGVWSASLEAGCLEPPAGPRGRPRPSGGRRAAPEPEHRSRARAGRGRRAPRSAAPSVPPARGRRGSRGRARSGTACRRPHRRCAPPRAVWMRTSSAITARGASGRSSPDAIRPLQRRIAEALRAKEREPLGDVLGVAVGDPRQPAPRRPGPV